MRDFYEKGVRPAAMQVCAAASGDWAPTYSAELFRISKRKGGFAVGTRPIPAWGATEFGDTLRYHLHQNNVHWAEDFVFQTQVRGVKGANAHGCSAEFADAALEVFLHHIDVSVEGQWFVDVGLEFSITGRALQWRTDSHPHVVQHLFPNAHMDVIHTLTNLDSKHYKCDLSSHIADLSGCRLVWFSSLYIIILYLTSFFYLGYLLSNLVMI
jgi:hypothetical protein